jgi:hypothetical protein
VVEGVPGVREADCEPDGVLFVGEYHWTFTCESV